jgi:pyruvate/2-oxoglutarate dehydrogenase complex dihydrolipoamide dehydrogenase (E3) component
MRAPTRRLEADLAVIGAGSGGLSAAAGAAQLGLKVVLFERGEMGGDCLNYGCVPSKALIAAAKHAHALRTGARFGVTAGTPGVDWARVRAHVRGVVETIAPIDSQERFEGLGVTVVREHARFADKKTVVSDSVQVQARRIVIATGGRAAVPPIAGLADTPYLTNETIFDIPDFPKRLVILGAGPIGVELGQAFRRLGAEVVIVEAASALGRIDPDVAAVALDEMTREGVDFMVGWKVVAARKTAGGVALSVEGPGGRREEAAGTHLLVAVGRTPIVDGLDLEKAGVAYDRKGVKTDAFLRTSNPRIFAIGDVTGRTLLTHAAGWHASAFVRTTLFKAATRADSLPMPAAVFVDPEIATVGLGEAEAKAIHGDRAKVVSWSFHENDRAQAERAERGFAKLIVGPGGRILGASVVGEGAGDIIQIVVLAMSNKLKVRALTNMIAPYPTRGEIIKRAAGSYYTPVLFSERTKRLVSLLQRLP